MAGDFEYQSVRVKLEDLQLTALQNRPDHRAVQQGVTAATSQFESQKLIGNVDVTVQANYSHVNAIDTASIYGSVPLPIFNRTQGEIARARIAITQAEELQNAVSDQVMTDIAGAFENLHVNDKLSGSIAPATSKFLRKTVRSPSMRINAGPRACSIFSMQSVTIARHS